ncbi:hypothetical protein L21SP2_1276 [Salinispira pacifica]|uniref:Uncharacterized protein n=1 Tax=Salinispira pacifica TaxID=1307761 RepID=V5WFS5_9SPIO|nr:hypothetical protein L21SP2_1276 [Salinispira pacifica]
MTFSSCDTGAPAGKKLSGSENQREISKYLDDKDTRGKKNEYFANTYVGQTDDSFRKQEPIGIT